MGAGVFCGPLTLSLLDQPRTLSVQAQRHISDLYEDLRDGHNLISLLEVLSGDSLVRVSARPSATLPAFPPSVSPVTPTPNSVSGLASAPCASWSVCILAWEPPDPCAWAHGPAAHRAQALTL